MIRTSKPEVVSEDHVTLLMISLTQYEFHTNPLYTAVLQPVQSGLNKIVNTLEQCYNDTYDSSNLEGLVVSSFSVSDQLRNFFYDEFEKRQVTCRP